MRRSPERGPPHQAQDRPVVPSQSSLPSPSQALRPTASPRQDLQIFQRRQQPLTRAVTACSSRAAARPLLLLLATRRRRHSPQRASVRAATRRRGGAGSASGRKGHRGGGREAGGSAPCAPGGALRAPAPSAGQRGLLGSNPSSESQTENRQGFHRGQGLLSLRLFKLEWEASAQRILSI